MLAPTQLGKLRQKRSSSVPVVPQAPGEETGPGPPGSQPAAHRALCLQRRLLGRRCLSGKGRHVSVPCPDTCHRGLRSKRTQPWDPDAAARGPGLGSQRHGGPDFSFELLPEARVIRVTVPPGPEVHLRLCHQWALECEEPSSPFDAQVGVLSPNNEPRYLVLDPAGLPVAEMGADARGKALSMCHYRVRCLGRALARTVGAEGQVGSGAAGVGSRAV